MIRFIKKWNRYLVAGVLFCFFTILILSGAFQQIVKADDGLDEESDTILQEHVEYTLYADGTAEVTSVGRDRLNEPIIGSGDEGDDYDWLHDRFRIKMGDITIPSTIRVNEISYTVTSIGEKAFVGPFQYGKITLPGTITYIGDYAFYQRKIKELVLPDSITEMGIGVLEQAELESELRFPKSMDTVPYRTFYRMITPRLVIPDTVTKLERYAVMLDRYPEEAWGSAEKLDYIEVVLSKNLKEAGECGFYVSPDYGIVKLTGKGGNVIQDGVLFNADKTELIMALEPKTGDYHIPKTVRRIHPYAFTAISQGVDPANGVTARIWVPEGVKVLEQGTFRNCFWLKSLSLPSTIERIETGAWSCIRMEPSGVNGLRNLVIKAKQPPEISGKQKSVRNVNVSNQSIAEYEEALTSKVGYKKLY